MDQTKQVFVDESGRRGRVLSITTRVLCVVVGAYLCVLVAGFLGASWVPSVHLPVVGDIFDVGRDDALLAEPVPDPVTPAAANDTEGPGASLQIAQHAQKASVREAARPVSERGRSAGRGIAPPGRAKPGPQTAASPAPSPRSTPNHGASSNNPNAGPKPKRTPAPKASPNHGANGNSENAGPKPKPTKDPSHPSNSSRNHAPKASPTPAS